jgi:hypothetical protein
VLKRIFGLKRDEIIEGWRKLYNEEPHYLYSSTNINRVIKSRSVRWAGHVESMEAKRKTCMIFMGKPEG